MLLDAGNTAALRNLLKATDLDIASSALVTRLWAGYGHVHRVHDRNGTSYIVKVITPPMMFGHEVDEGHVRKVISYKVEANFYKSFTTYFNHSAAKVPRSLYASMQENEQGQPEQILILLEDLSIEYPVSGERRELLQDAGQVSGVVKWLANFHARSMGIEQSCETSSWYPAPLQASQQNLHSAGLWKHGGYSYLATRTEELRSIPCTSDAAAKCGNADLWWGQKHDLHAESDLPYAIDWALRNPRNRKRLSLVHGDVKTANVAFRARSTLQSGDGVAMYDFQYVGIGLGVQDLAMFAASSVQPATFLSDEGSTDFLLGYYNAMIEGDGSIEETYPFDELKLDWDIALVSWARFLCGWSGGFWGNVEWLQRRVGSILKDESWKEQVLMRWRRETGGRREPGSGEL